MEFMDGLSVEGSGPVGGAAFRVDTDDAELSAPSRGNGDVAASLAVPVTFLLDDEKPPSGEPRLMSPVRSIEGVKAGGVDETKGFSSPSSSV